jgi:uncharacterized protein YutE (UPF0331/DUF86 family)
VAIQNDDELKQAVSRCGGLVQEITDYLAANPGKDWHGRIRFPRGFLKTNADIRSRIPFIDDDTLRRNVSYALMTHQTLYWIVFRTDISGQAREMLIKEAVCLLGAVCESISIFPDTPGLGRGKSYSKRMDKLLELSVIDKATRKRLQWLWDKRNQEHLYDVPFREFDHYSDSDWRKSVKAYLDLRDALVTWRCRPPAEQTQA